MESDIKQGPLLLILGIRPDVIRSALIIKKLRAKLGSNFVFAWSGQHYSENLKDIFFQQLEVEPPDIEMGVSGSTDAEIISSMIQATDELIVQLQPSAVVFLGDTNTVMGSVACAARNTPIVHIEGCMRSYDWRMPEEKYRTVIDHLADVIYAYLPEYKQQGLLEGLDPDRIIETGNPIVDILEEFFLSGKIRLSPLELLELYSKLDVEPGKYYVMTCHRRENVESTFALENIMKLASKAPHKVIFSAGYRSQREIAQRNIQIPENVQVIDPIGYQELLELMYNSAGVLTDSGTIVEETSILGVPSVQMRTATERPQVYDCGSSIKFDPHIHHSVSMMRKIFETIGARGEKEWDHGLGDGEASTRIVNDLISLYNKNEFGRLKPKSSLRPIERNYGFGLLNLGQVPEG